MSCSNQQRYHEQPHSNLLINDCFSSERFSNNQPQVRLEPRTHNRALSYFSKFNFQPILLQKLRINNLALETHDQELEDQLGSTRFCSNQHSRDSFLFCH
ncbi:hypothetical protein Pst134EB_008633 [Puccinia striiformis f. sp. tritici]|nr:hypothetical protein Pst134EB_008633 [Puccinia striiformis f. sp. tritici]